MFTIEVAYDFLLLHVGQWTNDRNDHRCSLSFPVGITHSTDNLDLAIKKKIQNESIRSRNSMIKEIRRELFEKITHAMRSQGV